MRSSATTPLSLGRLFEPVLAGGDALTRQWDAGRTVRGLAGDSRRVRPGDVFFARPGTTGHGLTYVDEALAAGALAIVVPRRELEAGAIADCRVPVLGVDDVAECLGRTASRFHGEPSRRLAVIGITGTNGKTSVASYAAQAIGRCLGRVGMLGTLGSSIVDGEGSTQVLEAPALTTPDAVDLHRMLAAYVAAGAHYAVLEVSSHGLAQSRVAGVRFRVAVFTNLGRDHLDFHGSDADYGRAKARLLAWPELDTAVINADDAFGRTLLVHGAAAKLAFTLDGAAATPLPAAIERWLAGTVVRTDAEGLELELRCEEATATLRSALLGRFNAGNLLAALGILLALDVPLATAAEALARVSPPPGRLERVQDPAGRGPLVVVDFAHTPDALAAALGALRPLCRGRLWCVFGCGGDRDQGKRPLMGEVAAAHADRVVVTSDNPRSEPPDAIIAEILVGMGSPGAAVEVEPDRETAIRRALDGAGAADVVLVAGKGHETVQIVGAERIPFDDRVVARAALERRGEVRVP